MTDGISRRASWSLAALVTGSMLLPAGTSTASAHRNAKTCRGLKGTLVVKSDSVVVKRTPEGSQFACYRASGRIVRLDSPNADPGVATRARAKVCAMRGSYVAYRVAISSRLDLISRMRVLDVRRGRVRLAVNTVSGSDADSQDIYLECQLDGTGALAWSSGRPASSTFRELLFAEPGSAGSAGSRRLACGDGIDDGSLAVNDDFVYWSVSGIASRAATVGGPPVPPCT
jgi:hypothetical protein